LIIGNSKSFHLGAQGTFNPRLLCSLFQARALAQFKAATCMTESLAAAAALAPHAGAARDEALATFYDRAYANKEELVLNKWFAIQARLYICVYLHTCMCVCVYTCIQTVYLGFNLSK